MEIISQYKNVLIADIDDTICLSVQPVSDAMAGELNRLIQAGWTIAFISGSTCEHIYEQMEPKVRGTYHILGTTGSRYVRVDDGKQTEVYTKGFDQEKRDHICAVLRDFVQEHELNPETDEADQIQDRGTQVTFSPLGRYADPVAKRAFDPDKSIRSAWVPILAESLGHGYQLRVAGTTSIDITPEGVDKGSGIRSFAAELDLSFKNIIFFGDNLQPGGNDHAATKVVDCVAVTDPDHTVRILKTITLE